MADRVLDDFIIVRDWVNTTGAQIILDVLAEIKLHDGIEIIPDESITYLTEFRLGYQGRYYSPRQILDTMCAYYGVAWTITVTRSFFPPSEHAELTFKRTEGERLVDMLRKSGMLYPTQDGDS